MNLLAQSTAESNHLGMDVVLGAMGFIAMTLAAAWGRSVLNRLDAIASAVNSLGNKVERHDVEIDNLKHHYHASRVLAEESP
jgi:uncharacterized membrane protein YqgA involved in biofilm formation